MSSKRIVSLLTTGVILTLFVLPATSQPTHLDLNMQWRAGVPDDGTMWHELLPVYCQLWEQMAYQDNGDGQISICDWINLKDPVSGEVFGYHIEWVGPTYWLDADGDGSWTEGKDEIYEPQTPYDDVPDYCDMWDMVYPVLDPGWHVTGWDDMDGSLTVNHCDWIWFEDTWALHVIDVTVNIKVGPPGPPVTAEKSTWGRIKSLYGN